MKKTQFTKRYIDIFRAWEEKMFTLQHYNEHYKTNCRTGDRTYIHTILPYKGLFINNQNIVRLSISYSIISDH